MIKRGLTYSSIPLALMVVFSCYGLIELPIGSKVVVQWDAEGLPVRTVDRNDALLGIPVLAVILTVLFAFGPKIMPRRQSIERRGIYYLIGWLGSLLVLTAGHVVIVLSALNHNAPFHNLLLIATAMFLVSVGYITKHSERNWLLGIKTPWSLSSDRAWEGANRISGNGFMLSGILGFGSVFFLPAKITLYVLLGGVTVSAVLGIIASFVIWQTQNENPS